MKTKKTVQTLLLTGLIVLTCFAVVSADTLKLKDGRVLDGYFMGGSSRVIKFEVNGVVQEIPLEAIVSLTFKTVSTSQATAPAPKKAPPPKPVPATRPTGSPGAVTVNAGTRLMIRLTESLDTGKNKAGDRFTSALEADLVSGGVIVAARGAAVYGRVAECKKAKRLAGKAKLTLELTDIMINNQMRPILTQRVGYEGDRQGTLKKVGAGAAVGGIADGSDGARTGAAVGAAAALLTKGKQIQFASGTLIEFRLAQPLSVK